VKFGRHKTVAGYEYEFYRFLEDKLRLVDFKKPILREVFSIEEQNNWFAASDKAALAPSTELIKKKYSGIDSPLQLR
jgi:hypothetical protein